MVILHVLAAGQVGGLERVVRSIASGQRVRGNRVVVAPIVESAADGHPFLDSLRGLDLEIVPIVVTSRGYFAERRAVAALCARCRPEVVHTHGYRADVIDAGVARSLGIPTVTTVHGFTGGGWKNRLYERLQRFAFRRFDAVVAVSRPLGDALVHDGVPAGRVHVIRNAWDGAAAFLDRAAARRSLGVPAEGVRLGWVGRLSHEKGADILLEALPLMDNTRITVSVVGDGNEIGRLRARAGELGVADRVTWHGTVRAAASVVPAFDVFVLSSRTEGTPMVLFEAMAAGVPIVAANVGGVSDVVSPAEAILVAPNDPAALAAAVRGTLTAPTLTQERVRAGLRRLARDFSAAPWLERYEELYRGLGRTLSRRPVGSAG